MWSLRLTAIFVSAVRGLKEVHDSDRDVVQPRVVQRFFKGDEMNATLLSALQ